MTRLLLLALALVAAQGAPGGREEHTVWEDEDAAREEALDREDLEDEGPAVDAAEGAD